MGKHRRIKVGFCQKLSSLPTSKSDPYCYECHLPDSGSELLIRCSACQRSFHGTCQRRNPQKPNYEVPSNQGQPHRFPLNESDLEDELMGEEIDEGHTLETPAPLIETNNNTYEFDCGVITPFKCEYNDDEVLFVCEKLAPERMRKHVEKIKKEPDLQDSSSLSSGELEQQMCTACRLLELRQLHNPPHMTREELCFLLSASFAVHRSWLDTDVQRYMAKNLKACDIALIKRLLFHNEILGVSKISDNIAAKKYNYLMEFLVDLLDLQHNIGVFFGAQCKEYEATKWLLRDVTHDIREIRSCSDCFRYSIEPNKSPFWFAKPCLQRHELVYAKHGAYPYWPAKVIRVLTKLSKYDVRFFGGSHSRALVPAHHILSIDTDISLYETKTSRAWNLSMRELGYFKALSHFPASFFGFNADLNRTASFVNNVLRHYIEADELRTTKRMRSATPSLPKKAKKTTYDKLCSVETRLVVNDELSKCQADLATMQNLINEVKRKRWCHYCLQEAKFDCCFAASYCTMECQRRDGRRHQPVCTAEQS